MKNQFTAIYEKHGVAMMLEYRREQAERAFLQQNLQGLGNPKDSIEVKCAGRSSAWLRFFADPTVFFPQGGPCCDFNVHTPKVSMVSQYTFQ